MCGVCSDGKIPTCISPILRQFNFLSGSENFYCKLLNACNNELAALKGKISVCHLSKVQTKRELESLDDDQGEGELRE